jgi:hypothetical protein
VTLKTNDMNASTTITEGTKFTITGMLNGQAGRKFIKGTNGIVTEIKVVGKGTKFETTMVNFKTEKNSMNVQFGGVAEIGVFTANASTF